MEMKKYVIKKPHQVSKHMKNMEGSESPAAKRIRKAVRDAEKTMDEDPVK